LTIPHRGTTTESTYFVTAQCLPEGFLAKIAEEYPYSSANLCFKLDPVPQRLKPISSATLPQA
jgi:hypothetical protein